LVPLYEPLEFQLAEKMVVRVIASAFHEEERTVQQTYKRIGDLGVVAEKFKVKNSKFKVQKLTVTEVYRRLRRVAEESGEGSQQRKIDGLARLLKDLDSLSGKYVVRIVLGRLRLGFSDATMLDALSFMRSKSKELRPQIEKAYLVRTDIGAIAKLFKSQGLRGLRGITASLGVPIMPALCQRLKSADEMISKMGRVVVEPKYDGQRVQIHYRKLKTQDSKSKLGAGWQVRAFTRNLEEVSLMFPELSSIGKQIQAREVILDSEAVGFDSTTGKILPFQEIITRKRKHAVSAAAKKVPLRFFVFDILYHDGRSLLSVPLHEREKLLEQSIRGEMVLVKAKRIVTDIPQVLRDYHRQELEAGLEGVVVKRLSDPYIPGRRGWSWVKFKEAEESAAGLSDTLDCVVMGYYKGRGKRTVFGLGGFLVGVRKGMQYVSISKIGTGLTDVQWREMKTRIKHQESREKPKAYVQVHKTLVPDVWIEPSLVTEIAADNITRSPVHSAGLALRFPRLVRFRDDKLPSQATTIGEVKRISSLQ
jgi:DNA ligase-1